MTTPAHNPFAPAVKAQLKARVAFAGPTGSGKTWTALSFAEVLAEKEHGRIAFIDTERDSARLYANHFKFDVLRFEPPYEIPRLVELLRAAEENGYAVVVVDSLTHFWEGEGGVLDVVDAAAQRAHGSSFAGWKTGTPMQRHMVDTFLGLDMHVLVCMRSKMEYVLEEYLDKGVKKTKPTKVGMAPVQRAGLEYEFTLVGDLDLEHRITFTKSRCDALADVMVQPHREKDAAKTFADWLDDGEPPPARADQEQVTAFLEDVKGRPDGVRSAMNAWWKAQDYTAERLTEPELATARDHLALLLVEQAEHDIASASGEPEGIPARSPSTNTTGSAPSADGDESTSPDAGGTLDLAGEPVGEAGHVDLADEPDASASPASQSKRNAA